MTSQEADRILPLPTVWFACWPAGRRQLPWPAAGGRPESPAVPLRPLVEGSAVDWRLRLDCGFFRFSTCGSIRNSPAPGPAPALSAARFPRQFRNGFLVAVSAKPNAPGGPRRRSTAFSPTEKRYIMQNSWEYGKRKTFNHHVRPFPPMRNKVHTWAMKYIISASFYFTFLVENPPERLDFWEEID